MTRSDAVRQKVLERDEYRCQLCGAWAEDGAWIEVHHVQALGMGGSDERDVPENMITLCKKHHDEIESAQLYLEKWGDGECVFMDSESRPIPEHEIWFHRQGYAEELQPIEARIQGLHRIDGQIAHDLWRLWKDGAWRYLDPQPKSFREFCAARGWDVNRASRLAGLYDRSEELEFEWKDEVTATDYRRELKNAGLIEPRQYWYMGFKDLDTFNELVNRGDIVVKRCTDDEFADKQRPGIKAGKQFVIDLKDLAS